MKNRLYRFLPFILLFILAQVALTRQAPAPAPDIEALKKHVGYLASDELEGRRPGTAGADKAADYIAEEFHRLKLGCATTDLKCAHNGKRRDGYLKEFPFIAGVELAKNNALSFTRDGKKIDIALGAEWTPLGFSANGAVAEAGLVFAGYGITAADMKYDDYANLDAKGKVAVILSGSPDGDNPHGQFGRYTDTRLKAVAAKEHGAVALVVIAADEKFGNDRLSKLSYDQTAGEAAIPVAAVSRQTAAKWFNVMELSQLNTKDKWTEYAQKLSDVKVGVSTEVTRRAVPAYNVVGVIEGNDPKLKREYIVIGAHYDHLGHGGDSSLSPNSSDVHHGADDNASGTAGMLELARIFSAQRDQLRRSVLFIAFSAEESGLIGSKAYINNPAAPLGDTVAMINLDMIGRLRDNKLTVGGIGTSPEFRKLVESFNRGFTLQLSEDGFGPSDHSSFYAKQIPVFFFYTGVHDDYHKPSDTADKINYEGQAKIVGFVADIARSIDHSDARPAYALARSQSSGRASGFRVYLGTVPNYAESNDGMLLDAVRDDSPATKAGLKAGDKIVKLAGRDIKNVYDYTYALGEMKADQEYEVEVIRAGERIKMKLTPQARR
ncbi:MAG TPA: M20/M25/M40 family metallo-hydrolase [Blastocatellia bacterium]